LSWFGAMTIEDKTGIMKLEVAQQSSREQPVDQERILIGRLRKDSVSVIADFQHHEATQYYASATWLSI
jgi:hypothetical protein